jgi:hypothetical protein
VQPPTVEIDAGAKAAGKVVVKDGKLALTLKARALFDADPAGKGQVLSNQTLTRAILWINDYQYEEWDPRGKPFPRDVSIPVDKLRRGVNGILLQCYNHAGARGESQLLEVVYDAAPVQPVLRGLFVGVGDYSRAKPEQNPLRSAKDAKKLVNIWEAQKGKLYQDVKILPPLVDDDATPDGVLKKLKAVAEDPKIRPDDLFVFYLGGHGTRVEELIKDTNLKKADLAGLNYLFCFGDVDLSSAKRLRETTIDFYQLYKALVKIPCRKLLLLDTCHSGELRQKGVTTHPIRQLTPDGVGPVIFLACQPEQQALGQPLLDPRGRVSGLFLIALAMTLDEEFEAADKNGDKKLMPSEIDASLRELVPALVERLQKAKLLTSNDRQMPVAFIPRLENLLPVAAED